MHRWAQNFTVQTQEQTAKHEIIQHSASCGVETLRLFLLLQYDDWSEGSCWRLISSLKIHLLFIVPVNVKQTVSRLWAVHLSPFLGPFLSHSCLLHMTAEIYWTVDTRPPEVTDQGICCRMSLYQAIFIIWNFQVSCWSTSYSCDKSGEHKQMISPLGCYRNWERLKGEYSLYCEALMTDSWRVQPA